jgi:hypothetical protein
LQKKVNCDKYFETEWVTHTHVVKLIFHNHIWLPRLLNPVTHRIFLSSALYLLTMRLGIQEMDSVEELASGACSVWPGEACSYCCFMVCAAELGAHVGSFAGRVGMRLLVARWQQPDRGPIGLVASRAVAVIECCVEQQPWRRDVNAVSGAGGATHCNRSGGARSAAMSPWRIKATPDRGSWCGWDLRLVLVRSPKNLATRIEMVILLDLFFWCLILPMSGIGYREHITHGQFSTYI